MRWPEAVPPFPGRTPKQTTSTTLLFLAVACQVYPPHTCTAKKPVRMHVFSSSIITMISAGTPSAMSSTSMVRSCSAMAAASQSIHPDITHKSRRSC